MAKRTAVATKPEVENNMAVLDEKPDWMKEGGNRGSENVGTADLIIPRLEIVQSTSPCRDKTDPSYIEGSQEGDMYNVVTRKLYGPEVIVCPIYFRKEFNVWVKRLKGSSASTNQFKGSFPTMEQAEAKVDELGADKHEVVDTPQHFCLIIDAETGMSEEIVVSMPRTKNKISRKWNSLVRMAGGDRFSRVYKLYGVKEENEFGKFYNFNVMTVGYPPRFVYEAAEKLYEQIAQGAINIKASAEEAQETETDDVPY